MQTLQCSHCDFTSNSEGSFYNHKIKHSGIIHACQHCDYTSWIKQPLNNHIQAHHEGVVNTCKDCGKIYKYLGDLKTHQRSVHEGIVYPCEYCTHKFKRKGELREHEQYVHIRENVITCKLCNQTFLRSHHLKRHMVSHTEILSFRCTLCDMAFQSAYNLNCHKKCHKENPGEEISRRPYCCTECNNTFSMPHHLKEHKTIHSKEMPFSCNLCKKSFRLKSYLKSHKKIHSKGPTCTYCGKAFSNAKVLEYHMVKHDFQHCKETIEQSRIVKKDMTDNFTKNSELYGTEMENQQLQKPMSVEYKKEMKAENIFHCSLPDCEFVSFDQNIQERKDHISNSHSNMTYEKHFFVSSSEISDALDAEITKMLD